MRLALVIFLKFNGATGYEHPNLRAVFRNYWQLLEVLSLDKSQIAQRLVAVGPEAGFDADGWQRLMEQMSVVESSKPAGPSGDIIA